MNINTMAKLIDAKILYATNENIDFNMGLASDLVSDISIFDDCKAFLVTGLIDVAVINAAEIMNIKCIIFSRGKMVDNSLIRIAEKKGISVMGSCYGTFKICGILYQNGIKTK